jgi:hypothetical protein
VTSNLKLAAAHKFYVRLGYEKTSYRFGKRLEDQRAAEFSRSS